MVLLEALVEKLGKINKLATTRNCKKNCSLAVNEPITKYFQINDLQTRKQFAGAHLS
jgi:hypothetical protein